MKTHKRSKISFPMNPPVLRRSTYLICKKCGVSAEYYSDIRCKNCGEVYNKINHINKEETEKIL